MKLSAVTYMFKEGFKNIWRNRRMAIASISSVTAVLLVLSLVFVIIFNITSMVYGVKEQFDSIQVFLDKDVSIEQIDNLEAALTGIDGVESVVFKSQDAALEEMKAQWGENGYYLNDLERGVLPDQFIVNVAQIELSELIVEEIKVMGGVEQVNYSKDIIEKWLNISKLIRLVGLAIIAILTIISTFLISNTIKLTLSSRRKEIGIMKYVGATSWFVKWPFLIEGTLLGLLGSGIALLISYYSYKYVYNFATESFFVIMSAYLIPVKVIMKDLSTVLIVIGCGIGALGSINSLKKHLNV